MNITKKLSAMALAVALMAALVPAAPAVASSERSPFVSVSVGFWHAMALQQDGALWAWGNNGFGTIGIGAPDVVGGDIPYPVRVMDNVKAMSAGWFHSLAIKFDGSLWAWGSNVDGVLGTGAVTEEYGDYNPNTDESYPVQIMDNVIDIATEHGKSAAVTADNKLWFWGRHFSTIIATPTYIMDDVKRVQFGNACLIVIRGDDSLWSVSLGSNIGSPRKIAEGAADISAGNERALALFKDGSVKCWRYNPAGSDGEMDIPQEVRTNVKAIASNGTSSIVIKESGEVLAWGHFSVETAFYYDFKIREWTSVELDYNQEMQPLRIFEGCIAAAGSFGNIALLLKSDGSVWAWGEAAWLGTPGVDTPFVHRYTPDHLIPIKAPVMVFNANSEPMAYFSDRPSQWAFSYVDLALSYGLVPLPLLSRYLQTTTRAEYCALAVTLYEIYMETEIVDRKTFNDTDDIYVEKAAGIGLVDGIGNNLFAPDEQLTREQAAVVLVRLSEAMGRPLPLTDPTFSDNAGISSWAKQQVGQVQSAGIMSGVGGNMFSPKSEYSVEQSIVTMMRLFIDLYE